MTEDPSSEGGRRVAPRRHGFPKSRRLKRQRLIRPLFDRDRGDVHAISLGPVAVRYRIASAEEVGQDVPLQIAFAVGRRAGSAVVRNRLKRVMRETFRVHQHALVDRFAARPDVLTLVVLFRGARDPEEAIRRALPEALRRIEARFEAAP